MYEKEKYKQCTLDVPCLNFRNSLGYFDKLKININQNTMVKSSYILTSIQFYKMEKKEDIIVYAMHEFIVIIFTEDSHTARLSI